MLCRQPTVRTLALATFLIGLASGCAREQAAPPALPATAPSPPPPGSSIGDPRAARPQPPDGSLTDDAYVAAGMPPVDRPWFGTDMTQAASVLASLAKRQATALPRYRSERSGAVFARLTAAENLDFYRVPDTPLDKRLPDALALMQATNQVSRLYVAGFNQRVTGDSELVELIGASLRAAVVIMELIDELRPTLDAADPSHPTRMAGLEQLKRGLATVISGCLEALTEVQNYRPAELRRLLEYLADTLPTLFPRLTEEDRIATLDRLRSLSGDQRFDYLEPRLTELLESLQ